MPKNSSAKKVDAKVKTVKSKKFPEYDHAKLEPKWRATWVKEKIYKTSESKSKPKCYVLDMFPYPSGEGLHVGHPKGYIATDVYARYQRMNGKNILHPMGFDAFGLPAENYAIKNKVQPAIMTENNIKHYTEQLESIGFSYDWERMLSTTDPDFYKWTQWIFIKLFEKGLAYESFAPINWCPSCKTGLANEDLEDGKCERCGSTIERKPMRQWVLRITKYADRMLKDLDLLTEWPEFIKELQRNWIGKSEGAEIDFQIKNFTEKIKVFTTRPDTIFGATYVVLAPEHPLVEKLKGQITNQKKLNAYLDETKSKTDLERTAEIKDKTGVRLDGVMAINPATKEEIPVYVADYVLPNYGTGSIMAVPAHDARDHEFAKKFRLPIIEVISGGDVAAAYTGEGKIVNSGKFSGMANEKAKKEITKFVGGKITAAYRLQDWVFSRQRYWGEPIPIIHCAKCGAVAVSEKDLPVKLPEVKSYVPSGTGESPLAKIETWVKTKCPKCAGPARRETNTMPQWAGSSWYYLRFIDPQNKKALVNKAKEKYWSPVDMYVGGAEHATRHLIYGRFWHKFLYDIGVVNHLEPFTRLKSVGLIMGADGRKMSKRWGNVVNPDEIVANYGADTLRLYEMFMGPFDQPIAWNTDSVIGSRRFLERLWKLAERAEKAPLPIDLDIAVNKTIKKVGEDIENFSFNTAISSLMILSNDLERHERVPLTAVENLIKLLSPFAPHMAEELWRGVWKKKKSIVLETWPKYDAKKLTVRIAKYAVQVNGRLRDTFELPTGTKEKEVVALALKREIVQKWTLGQKPKKVIFVPDRLINIVL